MPATKPPPVPGANPGGVVVVNNPPAGAPVQAAADGENSEGGFFATIPQLLVVGVVTGAAFAIGSGLVHRLVFRGK